MYARAMASTFRYACLAVTAVAVSVVACSSNGSGGGSTAPPCNPGASVSCACAGGTMGAQVCNTDGHTYGMCQCSVMQTDSGSGGGNDAAMDSTVPDSSTGADSAA